MWFTLPTKKPQILIFCSIILSHTNFPFSPIYKKTHNIQALLPFVQTRINQGQDLLCEAAHLQDRKWHQVLLRLERGEEREVKQISAIRTIKKAALRGSF